MKKVVLFIFVLITLVSASVVLQNNTRKTNPSGNIDRNTPAPTNTKGQEIPPITIVAENLDTPWAIAFLPDGSMLFTERSGVLSKLKNGEKNVVSKLPAREIGEGGLMGIAVDPEFEKNNYIFVQYTYSGSGDDTMNRVVRYKFQNNNLTEEKIITDKIPGASNHNGGRIKFGPDGFLYITTGDAQEPSRAQNRGSLAGKILRITRDGTAAPGNPFGTRVYSYGHRNPQGLAWDNSGRLWSTEHGRSGVLSGLDELNLIESGNNYGWPEIQGDESRPGMQSAVVNSGGTTWAPGDAAFLNGSILFTGLRGSALYEYKISEKRVTEHLKDKYGRLREAVIGPDNMIYVTTSNKDGRGAPKPNDDKIIKINPSKLNEL